MTTRLYSLSLLQFLSLILLFILFFVSLASADTSQLFEKWCKEHGKTYSSEEEKLHRLKVFEDNYAFVAQHNNNNNNNNNNNSSYTLSLNAFADLTHHEFKTTRLGLPPSLLRLKRPQNQQSRDSLYIPSQIDWRQSGVVTPVKDQASCGACWAFSATGAIEGINKIVTGSLVSLSEQELIDCDTSYNSGCGGGLMDFAYQFVIDNKGIDTEDDYPYQARQRSCSKDKLKRRVVTIEDYVDVPPSEEEILKAVASQPVSVGICGSEREFQLYSKGIFTGPCSTFLDHAVLIVGYGSENGVDYWIVKNSWGKYWGMNGYMHMIRNSGNSKGICGINTLASYPVKTKPNPPIPPPPGPVRCNLFTHCSEGETCCCTKSFLGICFSWKCCGLTSAVCCKDKSHCCPQDYPICDTRRGQCLKRTANGTTTITYENQDYSHKSRGWKSQ